VAARATRGGEGRGRTPPARGRRRGVNGSRFDSIDGLVLDRNVADISGMSFVVRQTSVRPGAEESRSPLSLELAVASVLALVALFVLWREVEPLVLFRPVDAVVLSSGTYRTTRYSGKGRTRSFPAGRVFYRYELEGEKYVSFQHRRTNLFGAPEIATEYARADRVRAWYNPMNRSEAVISRRPEWLLLAPSALLLALWLRMLHVAIAGSEARAAAHSGSGRSRDS